MIRAPWAGPYQGDAIVEERLNGTPVRTYVVDAAGAIVTMTIPAGQAEAGTYLVTWSGHGDALGLWWIETSGALTLANSYAYSTWGSPTTTTHNGIGDLGFRFTYVGQHDVQWDTVHGLDLAYMHARTYAPSLGRFLQPDPVAAEANAYAYAENGPVSKIDQDGTVVCLVPVAGQIICASALAWLVLYGGVSLSVVVGGVAAQGIKIKGCFFNCSSAQQVAKNKTQGLSAEARALRQLRNPQKFYMLHVYFRVRSGAYRFLDICEWNSVHHYFLSPNRPNRCWEVKSGGARYYGTPQHLLDLRIMAEYRFPIFYIHMP